MDSGLQRRAPRALSDGRDGIFAAQPFEYPIEKPFVEPDWRRLPGFKDVSQKDWESATWWCLGGDIANVTIKHLETFISALIDIPNIRDIRLATKALGTGPKVPLCSYPKDPFTAAARALS